VKIQKFKYKQLLKLHLLKSRVYEQPIKKTNFNDLIDLNLDQILVGIKKALQIIFQYHQTEKRILFIGLPSMLEFKINQFTKHIAVSNTFNIQGFISNNNFKSFKDDKNFNQGLLKNYSKFLLPKLTKTPDLVVLFDHEKSKSILSEAWTRKVPVIFFDTNLDSQDAFAYNFYVVKGNFKNMLATSDKNIFFIGLNFLFKNLIKKSSDYPSFSSSPTDRLSLGQKKRSKPKFR
jgi:Ribosomal protein S2